MGDQRSSLGALLLVIEQDAFVCELERFFLQEAGFRVEFADDGLRGLERAREILPAIVITEVLLPRVDGLSICRALRAEPATRHVRVLVFSVLSAEKQAREAGADAFLEKPVDDGVLVATVKRLIAGHHEQERIP
jgi:DNA-binding response OmpR family regulator